MPASNEQFQYTFRVDGTFLQFIEVAYTEADAREAVAHTLLAREGIDPSHPDYDSLLKEAARNKLRLVYVR